MTSKKTSADTILMAQILHCSYKRMDYNEIARHLKRDILLVAKLHDEAVNLAVSARLAHSREYYRQLAIGMLEIQMRIAADDIDQIEGVCSIKIQQQRMYLSLLERWGIYHGLDRDIVDVDELPPLLEIKVQQVELKMPSD